ncbi:MAG TPA: SPFH domain-containing protein [Anaerolineae bacterium]|nr:SPFH domain-containing protein [Anaerolineae bacterium]HQK15544.1 SPFH domain-containing protein [Anaerolineae bacterium]
MELWLLRLGLLAVYIGAYFALQRYLRDHPPRFKGAFVEPLLRLGWALLRMWGPLLWFLPVLLWIGMAKPLSLGIVLGFGIFIPLFIFLTLLWIAGAFPPFSKAKFDALIAWVLWGACLLIVLVTFVKLLASGLSVRELPKIILFFVFVAAPLVLAIAWLLVGIAEIIPVPADEKHPWRERLQLFTGFFSTFPKPTWVVEDGAVKTNIQGHTFYGVGPGWIMTEPENVVILKGSSNLRRVVGPGVALTASTESPYQVFDLRNQIRVMRTTAMTRDGIEINLPISSLFRIHPGPRKIDLESLKQQEPWPYRNQQTIFKLAFAQEVDPTGKTPLEMHQARPWDDLPVKVALNQLKQVVPEYSLEDIYSIDPKTKTLTRLAIATRVRQVVKETVEPLGFEILGGGVGNKVSPVNDEAVKQRVEAWKARWINKMLEWQASTEARRLEILTRVRSKARADVLSEVLGKIQNLKDPEMTGDFVAYYLLENLIHMAQDTRVQKMLPESALPTLLQLSQMSQED